MAIYYSEDYANRIKETYERIYASMNEVFNKPSRCTGVWRLVHRYIRKTEKDIPYKDDCFNPYVDGHRCTTTEGMDLINLFFYRKDFLSEKFRILPNAGRITINKLEEVYNRSFGGD